MTAHVSLWVAIGHNQCRIMSVTSVLQARQYSVLVIIRWLAHHIRNVARHDEGRMETVWIKCHSTIADQNRQGAI